LCEEAESRSDTRHVNEIPNFENSRWRTAAILKMVLSLYLGRESSDFDDIWCAVSNFGSRTGHMLIYKKNEIQNGGQPLYWKSYIDYISTSYFV